MQPMQSSAFEASFMSLWETFGKAGIRRSPLDQGSARPLALGAIDRRSRTTDGVRSSSSVICGSTASQQASTSRPFMRTAQVRTS
jgi:hypothetical protein